MPSVHVRLTPAEHEQLKEAADENRRSLQREIAFRLFPPVSADAQPRDARARTVTPDASDPHFRPDFGPKLRK